MEYTPMGLMFAFSLFAIVLMKIELDKLNAENGRLLSRVSFLSLTERELKKQIEELQAELEEAHAKSEDDWDEDDEDDLDEDDDED